MINESNLIQKTKELMTQLNEKLFNNELNLKYLPVKLSNSGKAAGSVYFKGFTDFNYKKFYVVNCFKISKNYNWTEQDLIETIAHELVHIYEAQVLKTKPSHGRSFINKMNELNAKFPEIKITLKHSMKTTKPKKVSTKDVYFMLSENKDKIIFFPLISINRLPSKEIIHKSFGINYTLGKIKLENVKSLGYKVTRTFGYSYKVNLDKLKILGFSL